MNNKLHSGDFIVRLKFSGNALNSLDKNKFLFLSLVFMMVFPSIYPNYSPIQFGGYGVNLTRLALLFVAILSILCLFFDGEAGKNVAKTIADNSYIFILVAVVVIFRFLSSLFGVNPEVSLGASVVEGLQIIFITLGILIACSSKKRVEVILAALCISLILPAILGAYEKIIEQNLAVALGLPLDFSSDYVRQATKEKIRDGYRVQAFFSNPLALAQHFVLVTPIAFEYLKYKSRILSIFVVFFALMTVFFADSRAAQIILLLWMFWKIAVFLLNAWRIGGRDNLVISMVGGVFLVGCVFGGIGFASEKISGDSEEAIKSNEGRIQQWNIGLNAIGNNPIMGVGLRMANEYAGVSTDAETSSVDNLFLSVAIEIGLIGLLLFIMAIFCIFWSINNIRVRRCFGIGGVVSGVLWGLFGTIVFFFVCSLYDEILQYAVAVVSISLVAGDKFQGN